jgi:hypothetical protein
MAARPDRHFQPRLTWREAFGQRMKRRRLLWRSLRARRQLRPLADRTRAIEPGAILCFATVRNEAQRLPHYLEHYRRAGVAHFLMVDNGSNDGTAALLADQPDVSLWQAQGSYREARFGVDWLTWLQIRHGHGHWCLTADADEILVFPHMDSRGLPALTGWLDGRGCRAFGALMLDMYPKGPLDSGSSRAGDDPFEQLCWFDAGGYSWEYLRRYGQISIRGGPRRRVFFKNRPALAPHMHKVPLIRWNRRYAYVSSTHTVLPRPLNAVFDRRLGLPSGVLLHSKFLDGAAERSREEKQRREHFTHAGRYDSYYDRIMEKPDLWYPEAVRYSGWQQLEALGLMTRGSWN